MLHVSYSNVKHKVLHENAIKHVQLSTSNAASSKSRFSESETHANATKDFKSPVGKKLCHTILWWNRCIPFNVGAKLDEQSQKQIEDTSKP
jgi:hypothetical protein